MKISVFAVVIAAALFGLTTPAFAYNYEFESGSGDSVFGASTSDDGLIVEPNPETENVRRNKDAAYFPPAYGVFSGYIPTNPSSLYHDNSAPYIGTTSSPSDMSSATVVLPDYSDAGGSTVSVSYSPAQPLMPAYTPVVVNTAPLYYNDGSIGTLKVQKTGATIKVFEGESLDNLAKGGGHFTVTSAWDGNVAIAGHNRGPDGYFGFMKNLVVGDKVTYTTLYGSRTYEVFSVEKIADTDNSGLGYSANNILSLYTCVADVPSLRLLVLARQI